MPVRFQVDPDFYDHPKVLGLSDAAVALWTKAGSYSAAKKTDGFVADNVLATLSKTPTEAADELRRRGLWHKVRGGYQFHQYGERNLTRDRIEADLRADRERKKRSREPKNDSANGSRSPVDNSSQADGKNRNPQADHQNVRPESEWTPSGILTESERIPTVSVSVSKSVSESVSGRGGPRPDPACLEHRDDPDPPACRRCKAAREAAEAWDRDYAVGSAMADAHDRDKRPQCQRHRGQLAHNCAMCRAEQLGGGL